MPRILSKKWIVSYGNEMWLLILVAHLFQRNVNSGHMPTITVDPEAFMNIVSWGFPYLGGKEGPYMLIAYNYVLSALYIIFTCGGDFC